MKESNIDFKDPQGVDIAERIDAPNFQGRSPEERSKAEEEVSEKASELLEFALERGVNIVMAGRASDDGQRTMCMMTGDNMTMLGLIGVMQMNITINHLQDRKPSRDRHMQELAERLRRQ